jgi:hypothetical protein
VVSLVLSNGTLPNVVLVSLIIDVKCFLLKKLMTYLLLLLRSV